jgi:hypothetical protein
MAAFEAQVCPLCDRLTARIERKGDRRAWRVECDACGRFLISFEGRNALDLPEYKTRKWILSAIARNASDAITPIELTTLNFDSLIDAAPVPRNPFEAMDRVLLEIGKATSSFTEWVRIRRIDHAATYLRDGDQLAAVINYLKQLALVLVGQEDFEAWRVMLTLDGWRRFEELRSTVPQSNQAFVAMWFSDETNAAWTAGIQPALAATGYRAVRVDLIHHNGKIDDRIVSELRRSAIVVADFTGHRGGVYFEAGLRSAAGCPSYGPATRMT